MEIMGLVIHGDSLYFMMRELNMLFRYDLKGKKILMECSLPYNSVWDKLLYNKIISVDNMLVFVPLASNYILRLNTYTKQVDQIRFDNNVFNIDFRFIDGVAINKRIIMIPAAVDFILEYNLENDKIKKIQLPQSLRNVTYKFYRGIVRLDNVIFAVCYDSNMIMKYEIESKNVKLIKFEWCKSIFNVNKIGKILVVLHQGGVMCVDSEKYEILQKRDFCFKNHVDNRSFLDSISIGSNVYYVPYKAKVLLLYDYENNEIKIIKRYGDSPKFSCSKIVCENLWMVNGESVHIYNPLTGAYQVKDWLIIDRLAKNSRRLQKDNPGGKIIYENNIVSIKLLCDYLNKWTVEPSAKKKKEIGKNIYLQNV